MGVNGLHCTITCKLILFVADNNNTQRTQGACTIYTWKSLCSEGTEQVVESEGPTNVPRVWKTSKCRESNDQSFPI